MRNHLLDVVAALAQVIGGLIGVLHGQHVRAIRLHHATRALGEEGAAAPAQYLAINVMADERQPRVSAAAGGAPTGYTHLRRIQ